ncbi:MAG: phosphoadenylyl-sulfate reductase [Spirochaetales bacterium]|jgi:phosphoadenosine phosphosulfate reductase|nr:phosphoadenylyl-sulfate reductase [Spirochaetales bacterium]
MPDIHSCADILAKIKGPVALAFSHQAEDAAVLHLALGRGLEGLEVFTLDTGKLFPETYTYHREAERFFGLRIIKYSPDEEAVRSLEKKLGGWGMRESLENRRLCCHVRKVAPLQKALAGKSAWITGLRASQSVTRAGLQILEYDAVNGLIKINPLAAWTDQELAAYIEEHGIPVHPLYAKGFKSIGCSPCTRAVREGEEARAGRWWWESPGHRECGLHLNAGHLQAGGKPV